MSVLAFSFLLGAVAGLRTLLPPTALSWAAYAGLIDLSASPFFFLGHIASPLVFTAMAVAELVADKLPATPARTVPVQFASRLASGTFAGVVLGTAGGFSPILAGLAGFLGASVGTFAGRALRGRLAASLRRDLPAALSEDALALAGAAAVVLLATG